MELWPSVNTIERTTQQSNESWLLGMRDEETPARRCDGGSTWDR